MTLVTKTAQQLPIVDKTQFHKKWKSAPVTDPDEAVPTSPNLWQHMSLDELQSLGGKKPISIRLDSDLVDFFKKQAKKRQSKYQSDINSVLRGYMKAQQELEYHK